MAWGQPADKKNEEAQAGGRYALPPPCPRCDTTKQQFNRTILNYQKAYRKKVEGLKTELKSVRNQNIALQNQVQRLRGWRRVHVPSVALGWLAGAMLSTHLVRLYKKLKVLKDKKFAVTVADEGQQVEGEAQQAEAVDASITPQ